MKNEYLKFDKKKWLTCSNWESIRNSYRRNTIIKEFIQMKYNVLVPTLKYYYTNRIHSWIPNKLFSFNNLSVNFFNMNSQFVSLVKSFFTKITSKRFLASMNQNMSSNRITSIKWFIAYETTKWIRSILDKSLFGRSNICRNMSQNMLFHIGFDYSFNQAVHYFYT